jgi:hypothetical protein
MTSHSIPFVALVALVAVASNADAAEVTYVSQLRGTDTGTCPQAEPCRTIDYALGQTATLGQVIILDNGHYGPITITRAVFVRAAAGVHPLITSTTSTPAVTVAAGTSDAVTLAGLDIYGFRTGTTGVAVTSAQIVRIIDSSICAFTGMGLSDTRSSGGFTNLFVSGTEICFNKTGNVLIAPTNSTEVDAKFKAVIVDAGEGFGIKSDSSGGGQAITSISDSHFFFLGGPAVMAHSLATGCTTGANVVVDHTVINFNDSTAAVYADGGCAGVTLNFSEDALTVAAPLGTANGGHTLTYGNNVINFNNNAGTFTGTFNLQ